MANENNDEITFTEASKTNGIQANQALNGADSTETATASSNKDQKIVSHPRDVAALVMAQMNNVNNKKDDLTIAIKAMNDTADQLVKAYAGNMQAIQQLSKRVKELEVKIADMTE